MLNRSLKCLGLRSMHVQRMICTLLAASFVQAFIQTDASAQSDTGYTRYEEPYHASQLLDGFGAILVAPAEPFIVPVGWARDCSLEGRSSVESAGCGFVGLLVSPAYLIRDVFAGVGDILTFGYFRISRKTGVFEPFQK